MNITIYTINIITVFRLQIAFGLNLGDNCIVFANFTASIGDLMVANWASRRQ